MQYGYQKKIYAQIPVMVRIVNPRRRDNKEEVYEYTYTFITEKSPSAGN